jgi:hypothetical protein
MALFPCYWLALLVDIPWAFVCYNTPGIFGNVMHFTTSEAVSGLVVYVSALQVWLCPAFGYLLVNVFYVSMLWGCYLVYALLMSVLCGGWLAGKSKILIVALVLSYLIFAHRGCIFHARRSCGSSTR